MGILFWPLTMISVLVAVIGLRTIKSNYLLVSAILIAPMSFYLAATPRFWVWGLSLALLYVGAVLALRKWRWMAILFVAVNLAVIGWIGYLVITAAGEPLTGFSPTNYGG